MNHPLNNQRWSQVGSMLITTLGKLNKYLQIKIDQETKEQVILLPWFSVIEWPSEYDCNNTIEVSHFSNKEVCEQALKEYLEDSLELNFETIEDAVNSAHEKGFKVWYAKAQVKHKGAV